MLGFEWCIKEYKLCSVSIETPLSGITHTTIYIRIFEHVVSRWARGRGGEI